MFSSRPKAKSIPDANNEEQLTWKGWELSHPELKRKSYSTVVLDDKIIVLNGVKLTDSGSYEQALNIAIVDPKTQAVKVLPPIGGDARLLCWTEASACYWKDSKIVVHGGVSFPDCDRKATVGIITLKDLDSENPSAQWDQVRPTQEFFCCGHSTHIYQDKLYVTGGSGDDIWCFDLATFEWKEIEFKDSLMKQSCLEWMTSHNKLYGVLPAPYLQSFKLFEYDLGSFYIFHHFRQVQDGKIYALCRIQPIDKSQLKATPDKENELWTYDIDSQEWTQISVPTGSPLFPSQSCLHLSNNYFIIYGGFEQDGFQDFQKCWYLPISIDSQKLPNIQTQPATKLQQTMKQFLAEAPSSDISFEVESEIIPAHRWWLTQKSKYFMNMFSSGMLEAKASKITITDMSAHTFKTFLEFLYSDHVELNYSLALELLQGADKYSIPDLKTACEAYLSQSLTPETYISVAKVAELVDADTLREAVVKYIGKNIKKLKNRSDFEQISDSLLRDSIVKFLVK